MAIPLEKKPWMTFTKSGVEVDNSEWKECLEKLNNERKLTMEKLSLTLIDDLIEEHGWINFLAALTKKMNGKLPLIHLRGHVKDAVYQLEAQDGNSLK